ncbi:unnamed protein product [Lymnaea stagnalis]|uniref:HP domain-containing protein n=1 Tax=Lymnaea stagnalis TaxID=6523 RepID=A0AAV2HCK9_LYMST
MERHKAAEVARRIKDEERGGKADVKIIEERWQTDHAFFKALGSNGSIAKAGDVQADQEFEKSVQEETKLFRVSDASGQLEVTEVGCKTFTRATLDSNDCFILDSGQSGIYVWIGKGCTKNEKKSAWKNATDFLQIRGYPDWTPMTRVVEGGETPLFKQQFTSWSQDESRAMKAPNPIMDKSYINHHTTTQKVAGTLTANSSENIKPKSRQHSARLFHCSNSAERFCMEEIEPYSQDDLRDDSVVILDTKEKIYLWTGKLVKTLETKACLKNAMESLQGEGGHRKAKSKPVQHVSQGDEPAGFTEQFLIWRPDKYKSPVQVNKNYPYSELTKKLPPRGVDPAYKEVYLTDADFLEVFGMPYNQFITLKSWQQVELKKRTGLF